MEDAKPTDNEWTYNIVSDVDILDLVTEDYLKELHTKQAISIYERRFGHTPKHISTTFYYPKERASELRTVIRLERRI